MGEGVRVLIAEDHTIIRCALRVMISAIEGFIVVGEAADGLEAIKAVEQLKPDLVLIDLFMPKIQGPDAIREIKKRYPETKILVLTMLNTEEDVSLSLQAGAEGYVLKDDTRSEFLVALKTVIQGKCYLSPAISKKVIEGYLKAEHESTHNSSLGILTQREREIIKMIAEGLKNKEIAEHLFLSIKTVEKHRENLRRKLDLHGIIDFVNYAKEKGLIER